jgi:hypothetical protein
MKNTRKRWKQPQLIEAIKSSYKKEKSTPFFRAITLKITWISIDGFLFMRPSYVSEYNNVVDQQGLIEYERKLIR